MNEESDDHLDEVGESNCEEEELDDDEMSIECDSVCQTNNKKDMQQQKAAARKQTFIFGECKICNDKATGVHYGIITCEGCKGFFKRNIQRNTYYQCFFGRNCILTPRTRNRCKACRFKRCIEVGMSFDGIKMGRIPKVVKKRALESLTSNKLNNIQNEPIVNERTKFMPLNINKNYETSQSDNNNDNNGFKVNNCDLKKENSISPSYSSLNNSDSSSNSVNYMQGSSTPLHDYQDNEGNSSNENINEQRGGKSEDSVEDSGYKNDSRCSLSLIKSSDSLSLKEKPHQNDLQLMPVTKDYKEVSLRQFLKSINSNCANLFNGDSLARSTNDQQTTTNNIPLIISHIFQSHKHLHLTNIDVHTTFLDIFMSRTKFDPTYQIICSLLNDKIFQLYNQYLEKANAIYDITINETKKMKKYGENYIKNVDFEFNNGSSETIWNGLIESLPEYVQLTFHFCKEMPGINELPHDCFSAVLNDKIFEIFFITNSKFFIGEESYLRLNNNVHYSRYWMNKVKGKKKTDASFELAEVLNGFHMTEKEKALLLPLMMTMHDNIEKNSILEDLNEYYTRAILYEFDLNKRDESFIMKLSKVILKIKECKLIELS